MPKTTAGRLTIIFIILFFAAFTTMQILVATGERGGDTFTDNLFLSIPALIGAICGVSALIAGLIAVIKYREKSIFTIIAVAIGLLLTFFVLGEFIFEH